MEFQIRTSKLTLAQTELDNRIYEAAKILNNMGYKCEAVKSVVKKTPDSHAYISAVT